MIGGGIVGLAVAAELASRGDRVTVLEKEKHWGAHQTGHNSNVVHAGLYYKPGSLKARMSVAGNASMVAFAREHDGEPTHDVRDPDALEVEALDPRQDGGRGLLDLLARSPQHGFSQ